MKTVASLGLLALLLSHSLGWSVAALFAGKTAGANRHYEEVQSYASAWHRFAELSERVQEMQLTKAPPTPLGSVLKILGDLAKTYLPFSNVRSEWVKETSPLSIGVRFAEPFCMLRAAFFNRATPPPEMIG